MAGKGKPNPFAKGGVAPAGKPTGNPFVKGGGKPSGGKGKPKC